MLYAEAEVSFEDSRTVQSHMTWRFHKADLVAHHSQGVVELEGQFTSAKEVAGSAQCQRINVHKAAYGDGGLRRLVSREVLGFTGRSNHT